MLAAAQVLKERSVAEIIAIGASDDGNAIASLRLIFRNLSDYAFCPLPPGH